MDTLSTRIGISHDLKAINSIINHYIIHTAAFFELEPLTMAQTKDWFTQFSTSGRYRIIVACINDGTIVGYACSRPCDLKPAYGPAVETTICLHPEYTGKGVGKKLYEDLFETLADEDIHRLHAGVILPNEASVKLHEKFGFKQVGFFSELARKFGRYWDAVSLERPFRLDSIE